MTTDTPLDTPPNAGPTSGDSAPPAPAVEPATVAPPDRVSQEEVKAENQTPAVDSAVEMTGEAAESAAKPTRRKKKAPAESEPSESAAPPSEAPSAPVAEGAPVQPSKRNWYVVKVQSGREESVKEAIERRVKIEGLEQYFSQVVVPVERETVTIQSGKRKGQKTIRKRKKFPGYIMAEVEYNDKVLYLFRETSGVGDFVGGSLTRAPIPMSEREVQAMLRDQDDVKGEPGDKRKKTMIAAPVKLPFGVGDKVRVRDGIFAGQEGEIREIREPKEPGETHRITVILTVFGRPTPVQVEHWQIENA
jgi:transcriptional antiterminator NusG